MFVVFPTVLWRPNGHNENIPPEIIMQRLQITRFPPLSQNGQDNGSYWLQVTSLDTYIGQLKKKRDIVSNIGTQNLSQTSEDKPKEAILENKEFMDNIKDCIRCAEQFLELHSQQLAPSVPRPTSRVRNLRKSHNQADSTHKEEEQQLIANTERVQLNADKSLNSQQLNHKFQWYRLMLKKDLTRYIQYSDFSCQSLHFLVSLVTFFVGRHFGTHLMQLSTRTHPYLEFRSSTTCVPKYMGTPPEPLLGYN